MNAYKYWCFALHFITSCMTLCQPFWNSVTYFVNKYYNNLYFFLNLQTQLNHYQKDVSRREGSCSDFQFKLHELTSLLEEKNSLIKRQSEVREKGVRVEMNSTTSTCRINTCCELKSSFPRLIFFMKWKVTVKQKIHISGEIL